MKQNNNLNLARKWRPKNFKQIIGQEIPVKMLLNSLYLNKLFPVYLFAGQRGCGKTSTARVLAAAINCKKLDSFRKNPKQTIPCMECESCKAMASGNHPDFIEIDAASHTGVENVRQILESCSYMPILGNKKIYLIDEAHMLSKAAFNAFLKILEEPPSSALFILATTEKHKFPDTVLSRCFQVIFKAIKNKDLKQHIKNICTNENIEIEDNAIDIIIQETHGSARDAINLLERVRFSETKITNEQVLKILGKLSESQILDIVEKLEQNNTRELLNFLNSKSFENINTEILWNMLIQVYRAILWSKFNTENLPSYFNDKERLQKLASIIDLNKLNLIFDLFWAQEDIFLRTPNKKTLLETILIQISENQLKTNNNISYNNFNKKQLTNTNSSQIQTKPQTQSILKSNKPQQAAITPIIKKTQKEQIDISSKNSSWQTFLDKISIKNNPFLISILSQAEFIKFNADTKMVEISLINDNVFTKETIEENRKDWKKELKEIYPTTLGFKFIKKKTQNINKALEKKPKTIIQQTVEPQAQEQSIYRAKTQINTPKVTNQKFFKKTVFKTNIINTGPVIDISDMEKYPKANLIQKYFPGKIKEIKE